MTFLPEAVEVLGVRIHPLTEEQLIDKMVEWATLRERRTACYINAHGLNLATEVSDFRQTLNAADLVFCDGFGAKWAAAVEGHKLPQRMTPPDWIDDFLERLDGDTSVFLLGDEPEVLAACHRIFTTRHPSLRISGSHDGFFDPTSDENESVLKLINESKTDVLLVGMGMPRQEMWIAANKDSLDVSLVVCVGALFKYYSGSQRRAPRWMTDHGFEWLGRLAREPMHTYRRYIIGNGKLAARLVRQRISR